MPDDDPLKRFDVVFEAEGRATGRMRNEVSLAWRKADGSAETFFQATDEGPFHGGENTAPPPLAYFSTALVGCLMTQIRAFARRLAIPLADVRVSARLHWAGEQRGRAPYVTRPVGFALDVALDGPADDADRLRLLQAAIGGCFVEQTLATGIAVHHRLQTAAGWVEV